MRVRIREGDCIKLQWHELDIHEWGIKEIISAQTPPKLKQIKPECCASTLAILSPKSSTKGLQKKRLRLLKTISLKLLLFPSTFTARCHISMSSRLELRETEILQLMICKNLLKTALKTLPWIKAHNFKVSHLRTPPGNIQLLAPHVEAGLFTAATA